jgi:DNA polymerase (family 10)
VARKHPNITVLAGSECDILADGRLDYPDPVLARLDIVVAAVHSRFKQPRPEMTRRICAALENPYVSILAHPTGRILGERAAYDVNLDHVLKTAKRLGKAIEINAYPTRLDVNDAGARRAHDLGVLLSIATDAHMLDHLPFMELGVGTARRGWIGKSEVINTWSASRLMRWVREQRRAVAPAQRKRR